MAKMSCHLDGRPASMLGRAHIITASGPGHGEPCYHRVVERLTTRQARHLRLRAQLLDKRATASVADVVGNIAAVQAQDTTAELLAVRVRTDAVTANDVERARVDERSVVRTWAMRGTLHLLPAEDVRWIVGLVGPRMLRRGKRHEELGLTTDVYAEAVSVLRRELGHHGPLTRRQIAQRWAEAGLPSEGQAVPHLLTWASLERVICFGPTESGASTHVLLDDWLGTNERTPADPGAELARRYLVAYGPANPDDFRAWSALSASEARRAFAAIADELIEVDAGGGLGWLPKSRSHWLREYSDVPSLLVKMLGAFDPYLLGYRVRDLGVPPETLKRVHPGGGIIRPTILDNGKAIATWTRKRTGNNLSITINPFEPLSAEIRAAIDSEVADIGRFLDADPKWETE